MAGCLRGWYWRPLSAAVPRIYPSNVLIRAIPFHAGEPTLRGVTVEGYESIGWPPADACARTVARKGEGPTWQV